METGTPDTGFPTTSRTNWSPQENASPHALEESFPTPLSSPLMFTCPHLGCKAKSFKRKSELNRHSRTHVSESSHRYSCPALDCSRTAAKGFTRSDKLKDHMLAGHDEDALFVCPETNCSTALTRDLWAIHMLHSTVKQWGENRDFLISRSRVCPMPRCSFRITPSWYLSQQHEKLDNLRTHLLEKHDFKGRSNYASTLAQKGFKSDACNFKCPLCPKHDGYAAHEEFAKHFCQTHLTVTYCLAHPDKACPIDCSVRRDYWHVVKAIRQCKEIPDAVRLHRRTILAIFPGFEDHPVWDDIKHAR